MFEKTVWESLSDSQKPEMNALCEQYKTFLNKGKTEREAYAFAVEYLEEEGFLPLDSFDSLKPGDKVYAGNRQKGLVACVIGENFRDGFQIVGAHLDAPRLDLKQNPLYEDTSLALFKTHYYGGIKKYQWTAIPLALHGVVAKKDGTLINIAVGDEGDDMTFTITDLLPHLAMEQMDKKMTKGIEGEALNILCGSVPADGEKDKVKEHILSILKSRYGMEEEDFLSAELEIVPAFSAKDIGFDRGLIGGYGQDDRVCAFCALHALTNVPMGNKKTAVCLLVDKEEIGSMGVTGMQSRFFEDVMSLVGEKMGETSHNALRIAFSKSGCLSADVTAGIDPTYPSVNEKLNATRLGYGTAVMKFTGARGKSGSSDANAEFLAYIRRIFEEENVVFQTGELGKVDMGGGGTIAQFMANLNIDTLDVGVSLLSMHAPLEVASKADIFMTDRAYTTFMNNGEYWY